MKSKKSIKNLLITVFVFLLLTGGLSGCDIQRMQGNHQVKKAEVAKVSTEEEAGYETRENTVLVYYINKEQNGFEYVEYELTESDPVENAKQILRLMSEVADFEKEEYRPVLKDKIKINKVKLLKDNVLNIDFAKSYHQQLPQEEVMSRFAVVRTLVQIPGINKVSYSIEKEAFKSVDGMVVGPMNSATFLQTEEEAIATNSEMSLYYATADGRKLTEVLQMVSSTESILPEQVALEALFSVPEGVKAISPLPKNLSIRNVQIFNNVCYVDLSEEIENENSLVREDVMIYSMVNTVVGMGHAASVEFTVDGEKKKNIHGFDKFDQTFIFNYDICE